MTTQPPPIIAPPLRPRQAIRYGVIFCTACGFPIPYCNCQPRTDVPSADNAAADSLQKRIAEVKH